MEKHWVHNELVSVNLTEQQKEWLRLEATKWQLSMSDIVYIALIIVYANAGFPFTLEELDE